MNKTIIAIRGTANQGKTQTILKVIRKLMALAEVEIVEHEFIGEPGGDEWLLAKYHSERESIPIGITSEGDPGYTLEGLLKKFVEKECDIILCASRTRGKTTYGEVCRVHAKTGYDLIWLSNIHVEAQGMSDACQIERQQDRCNEVSANCVFNMMLELIGGEEQIAAST